jgi:RHS repeat-associated protein
VDTPGRGGGPKQNTTGSQMVSLGLSGGLGTGSSSVPYDLLDVNGDGLPDRVTVSGGALSVGFNLGYGFAPSEPWGVGALNEGSSDSASIGTNLGFNGGIYDYAGGASLSRNLSETSAMLTDINGDGLPDRITRNGSALSVGFNTGSGFLADTAWGGAPDGAFATTRATSIGGGAYFTVGIGPVCVVECWIILNPGVDVSTSLARQESALLDVDGDGYPDHVQSGAEAAMTVARNTTGRTNLLRSIARPLGATIELDYARDGNTSDLPQSHWDLARVAVSDGLPGDGADVQLATFKYEKGMWDRLEREFYGYGRVIEEVRDASHGEALVRTITRDFAVDSFYTKGLLLRERLEDALGRPFTETEHAYSTIDVGTQAPLSDLKSTIATGFPGLVRTDRRFFEGQAAPGKATYSTQEFDAVGNVVRTADIGDDGAEDDLEATLTYSSCSGTHIVGTPVAIRVTGNGTELRRRDGVVDCATGDVTLITEHLADGTGAETALAYDALGNLTRLTGPPNRNGQRYEMHYEYDPVVKTHVTQVTDSFGYASTTSYDVALGSKVGTRDVDGSRTSYAYDVHGRLTSIRGPYEQTGANPTVRFEHHPDAPVPWSLTRHLDTYRSPSDPIDVVRFVDGLKRDVQEKSDASVFTSAAGGPTDVMTVSGRVLFDPLGRLTDRFHPVVEPTGTPGVFRATFDTVAPTHTTFDVLDRPLVVTLPDGTSTTAAYGFGTTREGSSQMVKHVTDANGSESAAFRNVRDLVTASQEILAAQPIWTSYAYDALDRLTRITDDHANVTRVVWDNLGRKTVVDSPDEGRTEDAYDLAGNRVSRVTANLRARGRRIDYDYEFKRLSRMVYPDFPGNNVTYTYGAPGAPLNRAGRVFRIVDQSGTRERAFGKLGETVSETRTIASTIPSGVQTYMTQYTLDSFNRMQQLVYPDGETLTLRYDAGGRLRNITGRKGAFDYEYLRRMEYDKFGERTFMEGGNGTRTAYAYRPDNRRLSTVLATRSDGRPFVDMAYAYDAVGNVLSRTNSVPVATGSDFGGPSVQSFAYDDLDRMTSSRGSYTYAPNKTDQYVVAFDYDTIYNMTSRHQLHEIVQPSGSTVTQGKTTYAFAYAYGGPQPHAATHVGDRTLAYDADGNQAGWQDDRNGTRRSIVWDEENRMQSLFDNGHEFRFLYDDAGDRVIKRGPQGETVYVNPWMTMRNGTIGTKHVWAGTTRIASKLMKSQAFEKDRYFYHADHSGSTNFVTDATGRLYEHLEYFPFGETWVQESSNTQRTPYAFTGKELDEETGLTYFGARFLDPRLGSFNSGEPLLVGSPEKGKDDPRFLSVYSYAHQNPQRFADPDGKDVIILVGQPGDQKWRDNRIVKEGFPAAAKLLAAELKSKGITAHIVDLGTFGGDRPSATGALAQKAGSIKKVEGVVYIGHGDPSNGQMTPSNKGPNVSVKEMVDAARIVKDGSFVAYGCEVSVGKSLTDIRSRGVNVYTTMGKWTWTSEKGQAALGTREKTQTPYGNMWDLRLFNITKGVDMNANVPIGEVNRTILENLVDAHNATK